MEFKGIDVSKWQGTIDWPSVSKTDVNFAIMRATFGYTGIDSHFTKNITNISKTNLNRGAYHYSYATSLDEATLEANHFLSVIKPYSFNYPVAFDIEDSSLVKLGKDLLTDITLRFCSIVEDAGYYVCLYSNVNWLTNYLDTSRLSHIDIWLAQWGQRPTYSGNFGIWQYTSEGSVNGISGNVDMNISYKDYPTIIANAGQNPSGNGNSGSGNNNSSSSGGSAGTSNIYTVANGDTLWTIAEKFLGSGSKYTEIKAANSLSSDTIYAGQKLIIPSSSASSSNKTYTVVSGDTLWTIAEKFLGSGSKYAEIKNANKLSSDTIYVGQQLIIP